MTLPGRARRPSPLGDEHIGLEARARAGDHVALRVWLRLLACSNQIETEVRKRLRQRFGITLSRFDYLAQLHRHPQGMRMNALSRYLMVTGGNVTGLTDELEKAGLVEREPAPEDRRAVRLRLTAAGRRAFDQMAREHEAWILELTRGMRAADLQALLGLLGTLRQTIANEQVRAAGHARARRLSPAGDAGT